MSGIISSLLPNIDEILGVRDTLGAALKEVYLVTRTWSGDEVGEGTPTVEKVRMLPSPGIKQFSAESAALQGGNVQQGDIMLKMISKNSYPDEKVVRCEAPSVNVEKYYEVGGVQYEVKGITEKHLTWSVHLRRRSNQE